MPKIIENVRELIVEKAYELFIKEGYDHVKTSRIAKECNIAAGTLFNYFPTKWDLLLEIMMKVSKRNYEDFVEKLKEPNSSYELVNHLVENLYYVIDRLGKLSMDFFSFMISQDGCDESKKTEEQKRDEAKALELLKHSFPQLKDASDEVVWMATRSFQAMVITTYCRNHEILQQRKEFVCNSFLAILDDIEKKSENQEVM
ncbi:MAG: TetR/AcrR family transcriptional regulator [Candidatus Stygibacter frigidus]|nr:TetR/AcrR family transcriptional regulator [Candidatus Stygibacter frigidus]